MHERVKSHIQLVQQLGDPAGATLLANIRGVKDFKRTPREWESLANELNADVNVITTLARKYELVKAYGARAGETPLIAELCGFKSVANIVLDEDNNITPEHAELAAAVARLNVPSGADRNNAQPTPVSSTAAIDIPTMDRITPIPIPFAHSF